MEWDVPSGWSHWGGFKGSGNTYNSFNATMYTVDFDQADTDLPPTCWQNGWQGDCPHEQMTGIHQAVRTSHLCSLACKPMAQAEVERCAVRRTFLVAR